MDSQWRTPKSESPTTVSGDPWVPGVQVTGTGPPVVLLSGMDGTGRLFYRQVPLLARSYRVATFALRDAATRMETLVDDVVRVLRTVAPGGEPALICGESFGGALAMSVSHAHPALVRSLVVLNSFPRFLPQHRLVAAMAAVRLMPWGAMPLVRRFTAAGMHSRHTHHAERKRFLQETRFTTRVGYLNRLRILRSYDMRPHLAELTMPTLFLAADEDHLIPSVAQATWMQARVPHARVRVLEGHGHICLIAPGIDLGEMLVRWEREVGTLPP